jgi:23S rRNA (uracil1939-C5)-methyltransferase
MFEVGEKHQGKVEKLVFLGKGLIRKEGFVIFVDGVLPGEEVLFSITKKKKSWAEGELLEVLQKSPSRTLPRCPYFGKCGGCTLQHMEYEAQAAAKAEWVTSPLCRIFKESHLHTFVKAKKTYGYRRHCTLHFHVENGKVTLGYFQKDNFTLLDIDYCPIFDEEERELFSDLKYFVQKFSKDTKGHVTVLKVQDGFFLRFSIIEPKSGLRIDEEAIPERWKSLKIGKKIFGEKEYRETIAGLEIALSSGIFLQNYPEMSLALYDDVVEAASISPILELYSGVGILSLLLAKAGLEVTSIEWNENAVALARENFRRNRLNATLYAAAVEEKIISLVEKKEFPTWIVNPPRDGLSDKVVNTILRFLPERLIYISCMPPTLARDVEKLSKGQYSPKRIQAYDMFPQSTHIETLLVLEKKKSAINYE